MNLFKRMPIISCLILVTHIVQADIELLERPAIKSDLAEQTITIGLVKNKNNVLAVGERGHVLNWQSPQHWQQESVPVSVALTSVTVLSDGTKVAVGHDSAIIVCDSDSDQWRKVFDGFDLIKLKIKLFEKQIVALKTTISESEDEDEIEELEYQLEELGYSLDDALVEQEEGPNKPLLAVTATSDDQLYSVGAYGTLLVSKDKGNSWTLIDDKIENPEKFHLNSVITAHDGNIYIVGENGLGFSSTDLGVSWNTMNMPYAGSIFGIAAQVDSNNLVAYGLQGNLMVSHDAGANWIHKRMATSASLLGGDLGPDGTAYIVGHGGIVVDFDVQNLDNINVRKHPSGAAFSTALIKDDALILVGQFGITSWKLK